jgi:hypothetical protein
MKLFRSLAAALAIVSMLFASYASADQSPLFSPNTGTVSGLTLTNNYNSAVNALASCNSGASSPINTLGATPVAGQCWLNTSSTKNKVTMFDGTSWITLGTLDTVNHLWIPTIGGGTNTIASAATTDLGTLPETYLTISGTTPITSFGSSAAIGNMKIIKAGSTGLVITYNASSLITPIRANLTTTAGDAYVAVYLGTGNWQLLTGGAAGLTANTFTGTQTLSGKAQFNGVVAATEQTIAWASNTALDPSLGADAVLTLTGSSTAFNPITNQSTNVGARGQLRFIQDATGGRAVVWDSSFALNDGNTIFLNPNPSTQTAYNYWIRASSGAGSVILTPVSTSSSPVLLNTLVASSSASLSDTTSFATGYRYYDITIENLVPVTNAVNIQFQPRIGGTFQATASVIGTYADSGGAGGYGAVNSFLLNGSNIQNTAGGGVSGDLKIRNPAGTTNDKAIGFNMNYSRGFGGNPEVSIGTLGYQASQAAMTGFQINFSSGNISTGLVKVYGRN